MSPSIDFVAWRTLAEKFGAAGYEIAGTASLPVTGHGFSDSRYVGLMLLCRTLSHLKGALLLLEHDHIVEARILTRSCFENMYYVAALCEEGQKFVKRMGEDFKKRRKVRAESIFKMNGELDPVVEARIRAFLREDKKAGGTGETLDPKGVSAIGKAVTKTYYIYLQLCADSAHPDMDALKRYVVPHKPGAVGGFDMEPPLRLFEVAQTYDCLLMATMYVLVGVNQLLEGTTGGNALSALCDEYRELARGRQEASGT